MPQQGVANPLMVQHPAGDEGAADRPVRPDPQQQPDVRHFPAVVDPYRDSLDIEDRHLGARQFQIVGGEPAGRGFRHV